MRLKKWSLFLSALLIFSFVVSANAAVFLTCDPQAGVTHYEITWTSETPEVVSTSTANPDGSMNHDASWLPPGIHKAYAKAGKEWKIREGAAADQLGAWTAQAAYVWSAPTYFEIDGGTPQPASGVTAMEIR